MAAALMRAPLDGPARPTRADVLLAVAVTAVMSIVIATATEAPKRPIVVAYAFAVGFGLLMLIRRQQPVLVAAVTCAGLVGYYATGMPAIGLALPVAVALYSVAEQGRLWWGILIAIALVAVTSAYRLSLGETPREVLDQELLVNLALMGLALALGDGRRSRRQALRQAERARELEAAQRLAEQRDGIARELHDAVGHSIVALSLHANAAIEALDDTDLPAARRSLEEVRDASSDTMRGIRHGIERLRSDDLLESTETLDGVPRLVAQMQRAPGIRIELSFPARGEIAATCPAPIQHTAFRVIQEALTNALKHAGPCLVRIRVSLHSRRLDVEVCDDGRGPAGSSAGGLGIAGMRRRVGSFGGRLEAGPGKDGGFRVHCTIPIEKVPA